MRSHTQQLIKRDLVALSLIEVLTRYCCIFQRNDLLYFVADG